MRNAVVAAVLAAIVLVPAGSSAADQISISANPTTLRWGQGTLLSGQIAGGDEKTVVTIQAKECGLPGNSFRNIAEGHVDRNGAWEQPMGARSTTTFRAVADGKVSGEVVVRQRPYVQLRPFGRSTYDASVNALVSFWHRRVDIQRFDRRLGRWTTIKKVLLTDQGSPGIFVWTESERFKLNVPKGTTLRAVLPAAVAKPCYLAGYGNIIRS